MKSYWLLCIFSIFHIDKSLKPPERIHKSFLKHETYHMTPVFESVIKYLSKESLTADYNSKEMIDTYKNIYKDACVYLFKNKSNDKNTTYLGWVPLYNAALLAKYYRNISKKIDFDVNIKHVPLYYLICEAKSDENKLQVRKILYNPAIESNIDMLLLKDDLYDLANIMNTTLDLSHLKKYDNGRWYIMGFVNKS